MYLQLIYFLNTISFCLVECLFLIDGTLTLVNYFQSVTEFTLRFLYRLNQPLWKIHGIASINFNCFTIDESNQVKVSRKIMRCQGYFFKIALGTRLIFFSIFGLVSYISNSLKILGPLYDLLEVKDQSEVNDTKKH